MRRFRRRATGSTSPTSAVPALVLVADDDPLVREVLQGALESVGHAVITVANGPSAVDAVRQYRPTLAVLDWLMPGMHGPEVCEAIRALDGAGTLPIVMLTTQGLEQHVQRGYRSGADHYLTKPFHPTEILAVVERLLERVDPPPAHATAPVVSGSAEQIAPLLAAIDKILDDLRHPGRGR